MSDLSELLWCGLPNDDLALPLDMERPLRLQIEQIIAPIIPPVCKLHPHEILAVDKKTTVSKAIHHQEWPRSIKRLRTVKLRAAYHRCPECPLNESVPGSYKSCPSIYTGALYDAHDQPLDRDGKFLPMQSGVIELSANRSIRDQINAWREKLSDFYCRNDDKPLLLYDVSLAGPIESLSVVPQFIACPQCWLEQHGIFPVDAHASFDNFIINPPALRLHVDKCRKFSEDLTGVLLLLGNTGTGKTHLAIATGM